MGLSTPRVNIDLNMKQAKLSFTTRNKRIIEKSETDEPPAKKTRKSNLEKIQRTKKKDKSGQFFRSKSAEKCGKFNKENVSPEKKFSNSMMDAVKTLCEICRL